MKKVLRAIVSLVVIVVLFLGGSIAYMLWLGHTSKTAQLEHIEQLRQTVTQQTFPDEAWASSPDFAVEDAKSFSELQVIATHNSYAKQPSALQRFIIDLVEPGEGSALKYEHELLWNQLENGVRSFELDIRWNGSDWQVTHVPLVANESTVPDFALGLEEIALWSKTHPGHLPISIMIEPKGDYMFLDPSLKAIDAAAWNDLDRLLEETFAEQLFAPNALTADLSDMRGYVAAKGWPTIAEMREKIVFFLSDSEKYRDGYLKSNAAEKRSIFTSSRDGSADAVFAVRDDPLDPGIATDVAQNIIVRTRADANIDIDAAKPKEAIASGANIISSDFLPYQTHTNTQYFVAFDNGSLAQTR